MNCRHSLQALVHNTPQTFCLKTVHETSWYLDIQEKSHDIPKYPPAIRHTYLKAQPVFHCKFPLCFDESPVNFCLLIISLYSSHLFYGHIYPLYSNLKSNSASGGLATEMHILLHNVIYSKILICNVVSTSKELANT